MIRLCAALCCCLIAAPLAALELNLPRSAVQTVARNTAPDRYAAPAGVFRNGQVVTLEVEGEVRRAAWRIVQPGLTPLQLMQPLRAQLQEAGFEILLDCTASGCGGFDFRFATETLPDPNMYVNIRSYHFVTGVRPSAAKPDEVVTLLTSASASAAYVQVIRAGELQDAEAPRTDAPLPQPAIDSARPAPTSAPERPAGAPPDLAETLNARGHAVLRDLEFETGAFVLRPGDYGSLTALGEVLRERPGLRVALVGHTDNVGTLASNIALSRRRAQSVRQWLIDQQGIAPGRLEAEGMGYLAPAASHLDPEGRERNRRVEVVLLSE